MKSVTYYPFTLNAGATLSLPIEGDYFRIQSATGAIDVTVDGVGTLPDLLNGQGLKNVPFKRLTLKDKSGATNTGFILVAFDEFIDNRTYGVNDLSAGSLNTLRQPLAATGFYSANSLTSSNVAETVFTAAANINGAILLSAHAGSFNATSSPSGGFIAKATAPTTAIDGQVIAGLINVPGQNASTLSSSQPQFIPAGLGLYYITDFSETTAKARSARFRLL